MVTPALHERWYRRAHNISFQSFYTNLDFLVEPTLQQAVNLKLLWYAPRPS